MREVKITNKDNQTIKLGVKAPFVLNRIEFDRPVDIYSSKGMNQDGASYEGNTLSVGGLSLTFTILAENHAELKRNKRKFNQVFNPKLGELTVEEDGRILKAVPTEVPFLTEEYNLQVDGIVNLDVHDPYYYDRQKTKKGIAKWQPNFSFPLSIPEEGIEMGYREPSLIVNIANTGDAKTGMKIVFRAGATVVNPSLFNVDTREYFKVEKTLMAGDQVVVATGFQNKKVKLIRNGVTSTLHEWDYTSTFMQLEPGDNLFRYDADDGLDNLSVDVYYTQKYLGV